MMAKRAKTSKWGRGVVVFAALLVFAVGCSGSSNDLVGTDGETAAGTEAIAPTPEPTATAAPEPTATPLPSEDQTPEPTPVADRDLPLVEAEQVALEFADLVTELFAHPRDMDISRMIQLEAGPEPVQPMTNWTLRAVANLNEENRYQPAEGKRKEVIGSQWDPEFPGQLAWVDLCIKTGGVWFDIDTNEQVMTSLVGPFVSRYRILTDSMELAAIDEDPDGTGAFVPCEFPGEQR